MTGDEQIANATVLIEGDRIVAIDDSVMTEAPAGAVRIDELGKSLMPGLTDMHVLITAEPILELPYGPEEVDPMSPHTCHPSLQSAHLLTRRA